MLLCCTEFPILYCCKQCWVNRGHIMVGLCEKVYGVNYFHVFWQIACPWYQGWLSHSMIVLARDCALHSFAKERYASICGDYV